MESGKAMVNYSSTTPTPLEVSLVNQHGQHIFFEKVNERKRNYTQEIDFSRLRDGNYCLCINYGNRSVNRKLNLSRGKITVGMTKQFYEPCFRLDSDMLYVSFFNCPEKQVFIDVYRNNKHVERTKLGNDLTIQKCLDLSRLSPGKYEIVLQDHFKTHSFIAQL